MKKLVVLLLLALAVGYAGVSHAAFQTVDLSGVANTTLAASGAINGGTFPTGAQTFGGVPFFRHRLVR